MIKKIQELQNRVSDEHKELAKLTQHIFEAIDRCAEEHRRLVAIDALAGIKPDRVEEAVFQEQLVAFKHILLKELEKTVEDLEHKGDKHWKKNYKDGVEK